MENSNTPQRKHAKGILAWEYAIVGSIFLGKPANDIDILLSVPKDEIKEVAAMLVSLGFTRNVVTVGVPCRNVIVSYSRSPLDIQIATPENYERKMVIMEFVREKGLHVGLNKEQLYQLYEELAEV